MLIRLGKKEYLRISNFNSFWAIKGAIRPLGKKSVTLYWFQIAIFYLFYFLGKKKRFNQLKIQLIKEQKEFNIKFCKDTKQYVIFFKGWNLNAANVGGELLDIYYKAQTIDFQLSPNIVKIGEEIGLELLSSRVTLKQFNNHAYFNLINQLQERSRILISYKRILNMFKKKNTCNQLVEEIINNSSLKEFLIKEQNIGLIHGDCGIWNLYEKGQRYILIDWEYCDTSTSQLFDIIYFSLSKEVLFHKCIQPQILLGRITLFVHEYFRSLQVEVENFDEIIYIELIIAYLLLKDRHNPEDILSEKLGEVIQLLKRRRMYYGMC